MNPRKRVIRDDSNDRKDEERKRVDIGSVGIDDEFGIIKSQMKQAAQSAVLESEEGNYAEFDDKGEIATTGNGIVPLDFSDDEDGDDDYGMVNVGETKLVRGEQDSVINYDNDDEIPIEPFNMKQEREEGIIDKFGHFVPNKSAQDGDEEEEEKDAWIDGMKNEVGSFKPPRVDIGEEEQKKLQLRLDENLKAFQEDDKAQKIRKKKADIPSLKRRLISYLMPGENSYAAMVRLGGGGSKIGSATKGPKTKRRRGKTQNISVAKGGGSSTSQQSSEVLDGIMEVCDELLSLGELSVYSTSREILLRELSI